MDARPRSELDHRRWVQLFAATFISTAMLCGCAPGALDEAALGRTDAASESADESDSTESAGAASDEGQPPSDDGESSAEGDAHPFPQRQPAPSLDGGVAWINTAGPLDLDMLRGKFVVLDFWTYCCINCMHVLPELKKLERAYPNEIVVIGVHSAKFDTEKESENITEAVLRYEIEHPVVNDSEMVIWRKYAARSWPSLRVIDPEGDLVAMHSGEIAFEALDAFFRRALPYYQERGTLDESPIRFDLEAYQQAPTPLRFPGKVLTDEEGDRLFISDSNHNRIVITRLDGTLLETIGSGRIGSQDGNFASCGFDHPQGTVLHDNVLYVADTENHLIRKVDLDSRQVTTIAGVGRQGRNAWPGVDLGPDGRPRGQDRFVGEPLRTAINSPWALWIHEEDLYIAMAGPHQIWKMPLDESEIGPYAGNGREDIVDGPLLPQVPYDTGYASFAQPSGLTSDGQVLYVADSEGSSIREVPFDDEYPVETLIGTSQLSMARLFTFGDTDGKLAEADLQHALGVEYVEGLLYVADTYNNKIKVIDLAAETITTLVGDGEPGATDDPPRFNEPAGISYAAGKLYVADTNSHAIRVVDLEADNAVTTLKIDGLQPPPAKSEFVAVDDRLVPQETPIMGVPRATVKADKEGFAVAIRLQLPPDHKINALAPMRYRFDATADEGPILRDGIGKVSRLDEPAKEFSFRVPTAASAGNDELSVELTFYYCQVGAEGLCKVGHAAWTVPLSIGDGGSDSVELVHRVE